MVHDQFACDHGHKQLAAPSHALKCHRDIASLLPAYHPALSKQHVTTLPSAFVIRVVALINVAVSVAYLYWRVTETITTIDAYFFGIPWLPVQGWAWTFYVVECCLVIAIWIGHTQRSFPVQVSETLLHEIKCAHTVRPWLKQQIMIVSSLHTVPHKVAHRAIDKSQRC